jgi:hypothetical protein
MYHAQGGDDKEAIRRIRAEMLQISEQVRVPA